jgi:hypothetical protein
MLQGIKIGIKFIVEATLQPSALAAKLGLVDAKVLITGSLCVYTFKIGKPGAAAKFAAATANSTHFGRFLPGPNLPHFYFYLKIVVVLFDQFPEINPVVCRIKKGGFFSISLQLYLGKFHLKPEGAGNSAAPNQ